MKQSEALELKTKLHDDEHPLIAVCLMNQSGVFRDQGNDYKILASPEAGSLPRSACNLRWSTGPDGTRYDLIVTDGDLEILSTVKGLEEPEYTLPQEKIPASANEFLWRVTARLSDGRSVSSETFTTTVEDSEAVPDS